MYPYMKYHNILIRSCQCFLEGQGVLAKMTAMLPVLAPVSPACNTQLQGVGGGGDSHS